MAKRPETRALKVALNNDYGLIKYSHRSIKLF